MGQITSRRFRRQAEEESSPSGGKKASAGYNVRKESTPTTQPWASFAFSKSYKSTSADQELSSIPVAGTQHHVTSEQSATLKSAAFDEGLFGPSHHSDFTIATRSTDPDLDQPSNQRLTKSDVILRKRIPGTRNGRILDRILLPDDSKVSEVLSQTVNFLSYEIDPILISEFIKRRAKRNRKQMDEMSGETPSVSEEDVSRILWRIISDLNSDEYRSFCDLIRTIGYDLHVLDFLEALDDLLKLVTSAGSNQALPVDGRQTENPYECTCLLSSDDERLLWNRTSDQPSAVDRHFEIRFLYADRESRAAQSFTEVERLKRDRRRRSRLPVVDGRATVRDTSDRYVPMISVRLFNSCLCEGQMRRLSRILESYSCIRDLAIVETRFDTPAKVRLGHSMGQNFCLFQLDLHRSALGNDGAMYLANALRRNYSIRVLNLSESGINGRGCAFLVRALSQNRILTDLDLGGNEIGDVGCRHLALALANNSSLRHLRLPSNAISSIGAIALFQALQGNSCLQSLDLSHNAVGDEGVAVLSQILIVNRTMREMALEECEITEIGCRAIARTLKANMKLRTLNIADNPIGNVGLFLLADGVKHNRSLEELNFDGCGISDTGLLRLLDATRYNATLKSVHLCRNDITFAPTNALSSSPCQRIWTWDILEACDDDVICPLPKNQIYTRLRQANPTLSVVLKENGITKTVI